MIKMDLLYWSRHFRNMSGEGDLDGTAFMRAVMTTGYRGPVSLKIFNDRFRGGRAETGPETGTARWYTYSTGCGARSRGARWACPGSPTGSPPPGPSSSSSPPPPPKAAELQCDFFHRQFRLAPPRESLALFEIQMCAAGAHRLLSK